MMERSVAKGPVTAGLNDDGGIWCHLTAALLHMFPTPTQGPDQTPSIFHNQTSEPNEAA